MDARSVIETKRDGNSLSRDQIEFFLRGFVAGEVADYQAAALLMAVFLRGMEPDELVAWTRAMLFSGELLELDVDRPKVDKHSTGGVGDKVSIPLAPAVAACGAAVPMISGRGLGHTGGTLDKLEAIPGLRTRLSRSELERTLRAVGCAIVSQTDDLVPADRKLYALRDVTGLVESIPLVASSILSKKLAEGLGGLVLDVKFGSGAFFPDPKQGAELARVMLAIAGGMELSATAFQTAMDRPLGRAIGHALEIEESLACLSGGGPDDLRQLVTTFGGEMLVLAGLADGPAAGVAAIADALDSGRARETFARMVAAQGGDAAALDDTAAWLQGTAVETVRAERDGTLAFADVRELGLAVGALGGGRRRLEDAIDPAVGLVALHPAGTAVRAGDPLFHIRHRDGRGLDEARARIGRTIDLPVAAPTSDLILARCTQS